MGKLKGRKAGKRNENLNSKELRKQKVQFNCVSLCEIVDVANYRPLMR